MIRYTGYHKGSHHSAESSESSLPVLRHLIVDQADQRLPAFDVIACH